MTQFILSGLAIVLFAACSAAENTGYATYSNEKGGVCDGVASGLPAVAMNAAQFGDGATCGQCVQIQGTGNGAGKTPVSTAPYIAVINNICPQCAVGDIDLQESGDGKFGITWSFVACPGAGRRLSEGRKMVVNSVQPAAEVQEMVKEQSEEISSEQTATDEDAKPAALAQAEATQEETSESEKLSQAVAGPSQEDSIAPVAGPIEGPAMEVGVEAVASPAASPVASSDLPAASRRFLR